MHMVSLLAPALGIAASPFGVVPAILLLFTPSPRANPFAFLAGWAAGVAVGFLLAALSADMLAARESGPWFAPLRLVAGVGLLALAFRQWRRRNSAETPAWMAGLAAYTPFKSLRLGVLLSLANPKVLLLAAAGGLSLAGADGLWLPTLAFALVASLTVAAPLLAYLLAGDRVMAPLQHARDWLVRHNGVIVACVLALIGLKLLLAGLATL